MEILFVLALIFAIVLAILGVVMSLMPALPGPAFSYGSLLVLYFAIGESIFPTHILVWFGVAAVIIAIVNNFIPLAFAKATGSSKYGIYGGIAGLFIGLAFFPPFGAFFGILLGAMIGEYFVVQNISRAIGTGVSTLVGMAVAQLVTISYSLATAAYMAYVLVTYFVG